MATDFYYEYIEEIYVISFLLLLYQSSQHLFAIVVVWLLVVQSAFLQMVKEINFQIVLKSVLAGSPHSLNDLITTTQQTMLSGLRSGTSNQISVSRLILVQLLFFSFISQTISRVTDYFFAHCILLVMLDAYLSWGRLLFRKANVFIQRKRKTMTKKLLTSD